MPNHWIDPYSFDTRPASPLISLDSFAALWLHLAASPLNQTNRLAPRRINIQTFKISDIRSFSCFRPSQFSYSFNNRTVSVILHEILDALVVCLNRPGKRRGREVSQMYATYICHSKVVKGREEWSGGHSVIFFDYAMQEPVETLDICLDSHHQPHIIASASSNLSITLWDPETIQPVRRFDGLNSEVSLFENWGNAKLDVFILTW